MAGGFEETVFSEALGLRFQGSFLDLSGSHVDEDQFLLVAVVDNLEEVSVPQAHEVAAVVTAGFRILGNFEEALGVQVGNRDLVAARDESVALDDDMTVMAWWMWGVSSKR